MIHRLCFLVLFTIVTVGMMTSAYGDLAHGADGRTQSPNQLRVDTETLQRETIPTGEAFQSAAACEPAEFPDEFRTIDGMNNNCLHPTWGSAPIELLRLTTIDYGPDNTPSGQDRPNVREISNAVSRQGRRNIIYRGTRKYSDYMWQWGQFLDHDIDLTPEADPAEAFDIHVPKGDRYFDPNRTGNETIPLNRSVYTEVSGVRQQVNHITSYIDASNVYGSDEERAMALRMLDGTGHLKTSGGGLLPFNDGEPPLPNAAPGNTDPATFYLAGDFRANEQVALTAMHTVFVREHNYWADHFKNEDSELTGDDLYNRARAVVGALMQHITYYEFLPLLLGDGVLSPYGGYQQDVNPGISNVFATAAYRFGHSMVSSKLRLVSETGQRNGDLPLREAFFNPAWISANGIEDLLRGLAFQVAQRYDAYMVDDLRNHLFGKPGQGGFDLASLNLQRGRDHGLPGYNQVRQDFGLRPVRTLRQITRSVTMQRRLRKVYDNVNDIDMWVACLAERPAGRGVVGPTVLAILKDQFERLRDGDRFWYEIYLTPELVKLVQKQTLAEIIKRNTNIGDEVGPKVFKVP